MLIEFSATVPSEVVGVDGSQKTKIVFKASALQWACMKQPANKSIDKVIDRGGIY